MSLDFGWGGERDGEAAEKEEEQSQGCHSANHYVWDEEHWSY